MSLNFSYLWNEYIYVAPDEPVAIEESKSLATALSGQLVGLLLQMPFMCFEFSFSINKFPYITKNKSAVISLITCECFRCERKANCHHSFLFQTFPSHQYEHLACFALVSMSTLTQDTFFKADHKFKRKYQFHCSHEALEGLKKEKASSAFLSFVSLIKRLLRCVRGAPYTARGCQVLLGLPLHTSRNEG